MSNQELAHAMGLKKALERKLKALSEEAEEADRSKEGRSKLANRLRAECARIEGLLNDLEQAIACRVYGLN